MKEISSMVFPQCGKVFYFYGYYFLFGQTLYTYKPSSSNTLSIEKKSHLNLLGNYVCIHRDRQRETTLFYTML
jgi:hypothetical protein